MMVIFMVVVVASPKVYALIHQTIVTSKILPYRDIVVIDTEFNKILNSDDKLNTIIFYRFYSESTELSLRGRMAVTAISKDSKFFEKNNTFWVLDRKDDKIQDILLNNTIYKNIDDISAKCTEINSQQCLNIKKMKDNGIKSIILIPVDSMRDYSVIGYVVFMFNKTLSPDEISSETETLRDHLLNIDIHLVQDVG